MKRLLCAAPVILILITAAPAFAAGGEVADWPLDQAPAGHVSDISGSGNTGDMSGQVAWTNDASGSVLNFLGTTGQIQVPNSPSLEPGSAVTVTARVRHLGSPGTYRYIVAKGATSCIAASYALYTGVNGGLQFYVSRSHGTTFTGSASVGPQIWDGQWHLVAGTFDGSSIRLYIDGALVGGDTSYPGALDYGLANSNDLFIGNYPGCTDRGFNGDIQDVTIWNRALSAADLAPLMPPPPAGGGSPAPGSGSSGSPSTGTPASSPSTSSSTGHGARGGSVVTGVTEQAPPASTISQVSLSLTASAGAAGHARSGLVITLRDSARESVAVKLLRARAGVRTGRRCALRTGRAPRHARACTLLSLVGSGTHADHTGLNTFRFAGAAGRRLAASRYELTVTPKGRGHAGHAVTISFTVRKSIVL